FFNVFISTGYLVDVPVVLTALNAFGLRFELINGKCPYGFASAHLSPCAMRARAKRLIIAKTSDDKGFCAHRTGNNPQLTLVGTDSAFTRDIDLLTKMHLFVDVVMMAIDGFFGQLKTWQPRLW